MLAAARAARPAFLTDADREIEVYRSLLAPLNLGTAAMYGAVVDQALGRRWLFLEKVSGLELARCGDFNVWLEVARWLATFHSSCGPQSARSVVPHLLEYDAAFYSRWLERARASAGTGLDRIAGRYQCVIDILKEIPATFIHGEFYASNILVQPPGRDDRICPVDWEMAATGPGLHDVAALASGKWSQDERLQILQAYNSSLPPKMQLNDIATAFECCRLHVALQWIGWGSAWSPPREHAQDWLAEAIQISNQDSLRRLLD
jgi:aminoglycoside phosphotransferase (APT) family kinase protein